MSVIVAGRSGLHRAAIVRLLDDAGFTVSGQAADDAELLRKVRAHRPDVAIAELPVCAEVLRTIRSEFPQLGVLVVAEAVSPPHAAALLAGGAAGAGYVLAGRAGATRFVEAVRDVGAGRSALDDEVLTRLLTRGRSDLDALSDRDREVLAQMAAGASNRGIARRMFLSERAIERHVTSIFDALGIPAAREANRRVLAVLAYRARAEPAWTAA